jgi:hypothetical protein
VVGDCQAPEALLLVGMLSQPLPLGGPLPAAVVRSACTESGPLLPIITRAMRAHLNLQGIYAAVLVVVNTLEHTPVLLQQRSPLNIHLHFRPASPVGWVRQQLGPTNSPLPQDQMQLTCTSTTRGS